MVLLFCSTKLNAQVKYLDGFEKIKYGHVKTVFTEEEAIKLYSYIMDKNGVDTLQSNFLRGKNPVALGYFKVDSTSKKVNVGVIVSYSGVYDVLFTTIKDQDTVLFTIRDENGELIDLMYEKPE